MVPCSRGHTLPVMHLRTVHFHLVIVCLFVSDNVFMPPFDTWDRYSVYMMHGSGKSHHYVLLSRRRECVITFLCMFVFW